MARLVRELIQGCPDLAGLVAATDLIVGALRRLQTLLDALVTDPATLVDHAPTQRVDRAVVDDPNTPARTLPRVRS
jgi:hypothetical protein